MTSETIDCPAAWTITVKQNTFVLFNSHKKTTMTRTVTAFMLFRVHIQAPGHSEVSDSENLSCLQLQQDCPTKVFWLKFINVIVSRSECLCFKNVKVFVSRVWMYLCSHWHWLAGPRRAVARSKIKSSIASLPSHLSAATSLLAPCTSTMMTTTTSLPARLLSAASSYCLSANSSLSTGQGVKQTWSQGKETPCKQKIDMLVVSMSIRNAELQ